MISDVMLAPVVPELILVVSALGCLVFGAFRGNAAAKTISRIGMFSLALAFVVLLSMTSLMPDYGMKIIAFNSMVVMDSFSLFMKMMIALALIASIALSASSGASSSNSRFEHSVLILLAGVGMMGMVASSNFLSLYVAMEMQAIALYVLVASGYGRAKSAEAGMKYFILGALSSALILFGIAFIYGSTGSLDYSVIKDVLSSSSNLGNIAPIGLVFIISGLAFKLSAVPFHMWTPDVYEGSPTRVTALLAIAPKVAAIGVVARLLMDTFASMSDVWLPILIVLSVLSMTLGAISGISQKNLKRLMAYSTIGNVGYMLLGIIAGGAQGVGSAVFYLMVYIIMTAGVFSIILSMKRDGRENVEISDLQGMARHSPWRAFAMAAFMLSMAGVPPLAGFFAKLSVFLELVDGKMYVLATYGILTSVIAAFYYLRVIKVMYFDEPAQPFDRDESKGRLVVLGLSFVCVVMLILAPSFGLEIAQKAVSSLF